MKKSLLKTLSVILRTGICVGALAYLLRAMSWQDEVVLRANGEVLRGRVSEAGGSFQVARARGEIRILDRADLAADEAGNPVIRYGLQSVWRGSDRRLLTLAVVAFSAVPLLQAARLKGLLRARWIEMGWGESVRLALAGNFLNFAAPFGSTAGDVFKAYYAGRGTERKAEAATIVFLDRALGLAVLLATVGVIAALSAGDGRLAAVRQYVLALLGLMFAGGLIWVSPVVRGLAVVRPVAGWLPKWELLSRVDETARSLVLRPGVMLRAVGVTLVLQTCAAAAFVCVLLALGMGMPGGGFMSVYAYFSAGEIVKALPGPPQGLGTMELAYQYLFAGLGSAAQILGAAVAIRAVNLACALPGAVFAAQWLWRRPVATPASEAAPVATLAAAA